MTSIIITPAIHAPLIDACDAVMIDSSDIPATVATYTAATAGEKTKIRNAVQNGMHDAVRAGDFGAAKVWSDIMEMIKSVRPEKVDVDVNRVVADRIIALRYAAHRLVMGDVTPDGIDAEKIDTDAVSAMVAEWEKVADPDAVSDDIAAMGNRMATQKITRATERGSIESHIETAFADLKVGATLTVAQIKTRSGAASGGAIAARLWPTPKKDGTARACTLDLVALGVALADVDGVRAVKKIR